MASIQDDIRAIRTAVYTPEVREAIADAIGQTDTNIRTRDLFMTTEDCTLPEAKDNDKQKDYFLVITNANPPG